MSKAISLPSPFVAARNNDVCAVKNLGYANDPDRGAMTHDSVRAVFQDLVLGRDSPTLGGRDATKHLQYTDFRHEYKDRVVPMLSHFLNAQVLNYRNSPLSGIVSPIMETDEVNFSFNRKEFNAMEYTDIAEFGIPHEQTHFSYGWTDTIREKAMSAKIGRWIATDPNFGQAAWMDELAALASSALLTLHKDILYNVIHIGFKNITDSGNTQYPIDITKLIARQSETFMIFALDPAMGLALVDKMGTDIDADTVLMPSGSSAYIRGLSGESISMMNQKVTTDPISRKILIDFERGSDSSKSIKMQRGYLHFIEIHAFMVNTKDTRREQPLTTITTLGQFYPPNPKVSAYDDVNSTDPHRLDITIFYQTKTEGEDRAISMRERLTYCNYWDHKDPKGNVSKSTISYADKRNMPKLPGDNVPWDWHPKGGNSEGSNDINKEETSYNEPIMSDVTNRNNHGESKSWRNEFGGITWDPRVQMFKVPVRIGDFHLKMIPNKWVHNASKQLAMKAQELYKDGDIENLCREGRDLMDSIANAEWTDEYLYALIDRNMNNALIVGENSNEILTQNTPDSKLNTFPGANILKEMLPNRFGSLDLPDKTGRMADLNFPPGFNSGAGLRTLAEEADKDFSLWKNAGVKAARVVKFYTFMLDFIREYIGKTDSTKAKLTPPWIHNDDALTVLIDSTMHAPSPVFVGIPELMEANRTKLAEFTRESVDRIEVEPLQLIQHSTWGAMKAEMGIPGRVVMNADRFLACLSEAALAKLVKFLPILSDGEMWTEFVDLVVGLCYREDATVDARNSASLFVLGLVTAVEDATKRLKEPSDKAGEVEKAEHSEKRTVLIHNALQSYLKSLSPVGSRKAQDALRSLKEKYPDIGESLFDDLSKYEKASNLQKMTEAGKSDVAMEGIERDSTRRLVTSNEPFRGDYKSSPTKYLRAPLMASDKLREFNRRRAVKWIVPANSADFYETPEQPYQELHGNKGLDLHGKAKQASYSASRVFESIALGAPVPQGTDDNLFNEMYSTKSTARQVPVSLGARRPQSDTSKDQGENYSRATGEKAKKDAEGMHKELLDNEFFGPWGKRMKFHKRLNSPVQQIFFKAVIQGYNRLSLPVNLAKCNAQIFGVMMTRPFQQYKTDSLVVMKAGAETMLTAVRRTNSVTVTKELRGIFHITVNFMHGIVRTNPDNVGIIPSAIPNGLLGGKGVDVMTDFNDYMKPNPNKKSMIMLLTPITEIDYGTPLHFRNEEPFRAGNAGGSIYQRKCSSFGAYFDHLLTGQNPQRIDALESTRKCLSAYAPVSHILHRGPTKYNSHKDGIEFDIEGDGPAGSRQMNMPGAEKTVERRNLKFPDKIQQYAYKNH